MSDETLILPQTNPFSASDRAFRRVRLSGCCAVNGGADLPCEMLALAIDRVSIKCAVAADIGDKIMFSFPEFGLVEATVALVVRGGFEASFDASTDSKLALYLDCLRNPPGTGDDTQSPPRIIPVKKVVTLGLQGEPDHMARVMDLSRSDVSVTTSKALVADQPIMVGPRSGHVVELFDGGATVEFDELIAERDFDPLIDLSAVRAPPAG